MTNFFPEIDMGLWNFESIKWGIIDSYEELNSYKESAPLSHWINKYLSNKKIIDGDIYNLTKKIANNFIDSEFHIPISIEGKKLVNNASV